MASSQIGHIPATEGEKMHHEEGIVIVGGGFGGLCFAAALRKHYHTLFSNCYYDFMRKYETSFD